MMMARMKELGYICYPKAPKTINSNTKSKKVKKDNGK